MPLVKVKEKYQVTIPNSLRERVGLNVGDFLEATVERGVITLTPQTILDRRLAEGLEDIKAGRTYGPYASVAEAERAFRARTSPKASKLRRPRSQKG